MKNIFCSFVLILFCSAALAAFECPKPAAPGAIAVENALDCPWAGAAREMMAKAEKNEAVEPVFDAYTPGILRQIAIDRMDPTLKHLWGASLNFDEMAGSMIVHPAIVSYISGTLGVFAPKGKIVHAGAEHTYGYLFSLLETKFGFKRARWVRDDIEAGLNLPRGLLGPAPAEGSLLLNVTCLAGGIALTDDPVSLNMFKQQYNRCSAPIKQFLSGRIQLIRLAESVVLSGRTVILKTDFIPFSRVSADGNAYLLIYSVYDSAIKRTVLITAFPVSQVFVDNATNPANLGPNKPIQTRYNAWVEGLTGNKVSGLREVMRTVK